MVLPVNFPDGNTERLEDNSKSHIEQLMFREKVADEEGDANFPYESVRAYYQRSSYGKLNISGDVMDWYTLPHEADYYKQATADEFCYDSDKENYNDNDELHYVRQMRAQASIIKEVLDYNISNGLDVSKYDNDNDGYIDCIYILWNHDDISYENDNFWWAYQNYYEGTQENVTDNFDGLNCFAYVWVSVQPSEDNANNRGAATWIHEFGHILGLPDYYDYDWGNWNGETDSESWSALVAPHGGTGSLGMMDRSIGDMDSFSKLMLGWIEPEIVTGGTKNIELRPLSEKPDAVLVKSEFSNSLADEYYMVEYRRATNNDNNIEPGYDSRDKLHTYENSGITIWHINASLNQNGYLKYDNTGYKDEPLKLIDRVVSDGTEHINQKAVTKYYDMEGFWDLGDWSASSNDFYHAGKSFTSTSNPSSNFNENEYAGISITNFRTTLNGMTATYTVDAPSAVNSYYDKTLDKFVVEFDRDIVIDEIKNVKLTIRRTNPDIQCQIEGRKLYITPSTDIEHDYIYSIEIGAGSVKSINGAGNSLYNSSVYVPVDYYCSSFEFCDSSKNTINKLPANTSNLYIKGNVICNSENTKKIKVILAEYNKSTNTLNSVQFRTVSISKDTDADIFESYTTNSNCYYKAFLWISTETLEPIKGSIEIK